MIGIRRKLILGFGALIVIVATIGALTMAQIDRLGRAIDVILRENYSSVVACQNLKEALERMDSGVLFSFAGSETEGKRYIQEYTAKFEAALNIELSNITLPGEQERADRIKTLFAEYKSVIPQITDVSRPESDRRNTYFSTLLSLFQEIKGLAQDILEMNQRNMNEANDNARGLAASAHRRMLTAILACAAIAVLLSILAQRWILNPINKLIDSTNEIRGGNLDIVLESGSRDEIGRLSNSFNEMTASLRQVRKDDEINLIRTRRATEEVFKALPSAIAIIDLDGRVKVSTETAKRVFGFQPGILVTDLRYPWLPPLIQRALVEDRMAKPESGDHLVQQFIDNREYFFQPMVAPIPVGPERRERTGAAIILEDVTQSREQREIKRSVVSTVSHQLKTPLTSLRMSVHLLLQERAGAINEKQTELLLAARDDSERLAAILDDLLDLDRIGSGKSQIVAQRVSPRKLAANALEPFLAEARDKGITLTTAVPDDLPDVLADPEKLMHVFSNLLSNALRYTGPGGAVTIRARPEGENARFSVEDTGGGIPPEHLAHLFDQFYRAPGQDEKSGVGLGLAIVKEIIQAHGGEVGAESQPGAGFTCWFTLSLAKE